jgi:hypothetical protein
MEEWVFFFHYSNKIRNRERNGWWVLFAAIYNNNDLQKSRESSAESERELLLHYFSAEEGVFCGFSKRKGCCFGREKQRALLAVFVQ